MRRSPLLNHVGHRVTHAYALELRRSRRDQADQCDALPPRGDDDDPARPIHRLPRVCRDAFISRWVAEYLAHSRRRIA